MTTPIYRQPAFLPGIIIAVCLVVGIGVLFASQNRQPPVPVEVRLQAIGKELPLFDGHSIADGKRVDGNCYGINEAANLPGIEHKQSIAPGTFKQISKDYRETVTASKGITWTEGGHFYDGAQSDPFIREGKRYTLTVIEYSTPENHLSIKLSACDY